jgi:phthalate 4,5-dioxygenase
MLSAEDNELLTRVAPGTPMGALMRQYWLPALLSSELPDGDCDPVRLMLLGEKLVAFRDTSGRVGLLRHLCPHRGAPLFLGRNEDNGLRCVYHGWKFDVTGRCVDMPNEPPESDFKRKIKPAGYPCVERGGVVWAYLGPRAEPPPLPALEALDTPPEERVILPLMVNCNWLQVVEGGLDTVHVSFLHAGHVRPQDAPPGSFLEHITRDRTLRYKVCDTDYGYICGAYRPAGDEHYYWRIAQFLFPFYAMVPTGVLGAKVETLMTVPLDDAHTMQYAILRKGTGTYIAPGQTVGLLPDLTPLLPNSTDWLGRFRSTKNTANDYLIDREAQRRGDSFTGISGFVHEDLAMTEQMGPILDRSIEHLGTTDMAVIRLRRRLISAARALAETGTVPPCVDDPTLYQQRAGGVVLPRDADWMNVTEELRRAGLAHPGLDLTISGGA